MKIYFAGSIRGGRDDVDLYHKIIEHLQTHGEVLTEHVGAKSLVLMGEDGLDDTYIHDRDMAWVLACDRVVAEVTQPSLGVGYEIGRAIENDKQILCLYREQPNKRLSAMINGARVKNAQVKIVQVKNVKYTTLEEAKTAIDDFLK
mgnify:CR=1 FL=1